MDEVNEPECTYQIFSLIRDINSVSCIQIKENVFGPFTFMQFIYKILYFSYDMFKSKVYVK